MILFEEALKRVIQSGRPIGTKTVPIMESMGKGLAADIRSDMNMPPFDKSAMDGYACRRQDLKNELTVIEMIPAGGFPRKKIGENECAKIMTGAPVPDGADTVIMVEHTRQVADNKIVFLKEHSKSNICQKAEDVRQGEMVLKKGTHIQPKHIPVMASVGVTETKVYRCPRIAIIATGNELVEPGSKPDKAQIRNTNAYQLMAQSRQMGLPVKYMGLAKDTHGEIMGLLKKAQTVAEIIILTGGVSMGDFDFVPGILKENGVKVLFHGIYAKPGKRTLFGVGNKQWFFGLPGNPVSSFVQFEMLVKPLIYKIMGINERPLVLKLPLNDNYHRKSGGRKAFQPVKILENGSVGQIDYHGSAHMNALSYAQGLMIIEKGITELKKGELVNVRPI